MRRRRQKRRLGSADGRATHISCAPTLLKPLAQLCGYDVSAQLRTLQTASPASLSSSHTFRVPAMNGDGGMHTIPIPVIPDGDDFFPI